MMTDYPVEAALAGQTAQKLSDYASLWADLLYVGQVLHEREQLDNLPSNLFQRRGLWEGALSGYGRCFNSGRRRSSIKPQLDTLPPELGACHAWALDVRDKHVAHRVDQAAESVLVNAVFDPLQTSIDSVRVRVRVSIGPAEEAQAVRLADLVKRLRDDVWIHYLRPLEVRLIEEARSGISQLLKEAYVPGLTDDTVVTITIDPSY